jgi:tetratricopeptide (TPR) repeat protein
MMVVGEPGIGKTSVCEELATFVTLRGGMTLWGHCYEEGSLSLPYLAFVEALRSYVLDRDPEELKKEMGSGASDVARIVSEVRERLHVEPREAVSPEEDRYRLMQAVTSFLKNAATVKPMLVILEDLHDADKGTLEMLSYVSRNLIGTRLLLIGTYRDVEVDRNHPLSAALAELRRVSTFGRVLLRGLNVDEVRRMLARITHEEIPVGLAEAVHRQTEGNPLFVQEVVRYLTEEKLLVTSGGRMKTSDITQIEMNIPEGLRDVIGKRLTNLSEKCNIVLSIAAVIGREFRLDVLEKVTGITEEEVYKALEEAKGAAIVEERSAVGVAITYRFTHAYFRQTLYEEIIAPRRIRLHQQVAQTLEVIYANRLTEHAVELAEHFSYSPDLDDLGKAVEYGEMAARRATDVYDYGEAVRLLERAIKVQEVFAPGDKGRMCDLLLALCEALYLVPDVERTIIEAETAFSLAESLGDDSRAVRACMPAIYSIFAEQASLASPEAGKWAERVDRFAKPDTVERIYADASIGVRKLWTGDSKSSLGLLDQAVDLAYRLGDQQALWLATAFLLFCLSPPQHIEKRMQCCEKLWAGSHAGLNVLTSYATWWIIETSLSTGHRKLATEVWDELKTLAEHTGNTQPQLMSESVNAAMTLIDGRLLDVADIIENIKLRGKDAGLSTMTSIFTFPGIRARLYMGEPEELDSATERTSIPCLVYAHLGQNDRALTILEERVVKRHGFGAPEDTVPAWIDMLYLEAAILVNCRKAVEMLINRLNVPSLQTSGLYFPTCVPRHLGEAANLLERYDEAREHYKEAMRVCTEMRFRPELALSRLGLAELLLDHYPDEKAEALEYLDFSIKEFREMKMQPSLERALRRKDILKA